MDDDVDLFAILALAGAGVGLMLVGSLDLAGLAVVLAVVVPALAAGLISIVVATVQWRAGAYARIVGPERAPHSAVRRRRPPSDPVPAA